MADGSRAFADRKHASGQWRSRTVATASPLVRALASFVSFKRAGVIALARSFRDSGGVAVDLGAGQGAYAQLFATTGGMSVVAVDHSFEALRRLAPPPRGKVLCLCADAHHLPLRAEAAHTLYSVDTLGHVSSPAAVMGEMARVVEPGAPLFVHSECADYATRWPDRMLQSRLGYDLLAKHDGHVSLLPSGELRTLAARYFTVERAWSPAGITGWLTGYPEKYRLAFAAARRPVLAFVCAVFAVIKRWPPTGALLRLLNAGLNYLELAIGLQGGGSAFMRLRKAKAGIVSHERRNA